MTYRYYYQTRENENREGEVKARNRAEAYAALRKQGIRPYRVVGDDPVNWLPWVIGGVVAFLVTALVLVLLLPSDSADRTPRLRQQIVGDAALIAKGVACDWEEQLAYPIDRYLAAYAQPGGTAVPPYVETNEYARLVADLEHPLEFTEGERTEYRQLKCILMTLRDEMRSALTAGVTIAEHFAFLEERQREEIAFRQKALDSVQRAPESYREKMLASVNARLIGRGIAPLSLPKE